MGIGLLSAITVCTAETVSDARNLLSIKSCVTY